MGFNVKHFFGEVPGQTSTADPVDSLLLVPQHILLSGPPHCGKSSLLLQFAYNTALDKSACVVFICNRMHLETNPPVVSQGVDPRSEVFERIHFKYVSNDDELRKYFAAFHLQTTLPQAVIIDNFCSLFPEKNYGQKKVQEIGVVKTLALCRNAIDYANEKLLPGKKCDFVVSDTHVGGASRFFYLLRRWLPIHCSVRSEHMKAIAVGPTSFVCSISEDRGVTTTDQATYTKTDDFLRLVGLDQSTVTL